MLVIASNSSIIERGYAALKGIKSDKRSRLEDEQLERLLILSVNLPELTDFDIQSVAVIGKRVNRLSSPGRSV